MPDNELKAIIFNRKYIRGQVTKNLNNISQDLDSYTKQKKQISLKTAKDLQQKLISLNEKIVVLKWDESDIEESHILQEYETCAEYDGRILETITLLEESIGAEETASSTRITSTQTKLKPPTAPLPTFSGREGESLEKFINGFEAVVDKYSYHSYEKFLLLKKQISGRALMLIESLESHKQSYNDAKELLTEALASPLTQKYEAIQRLLDLSLTYNTDPFKFISEMRTISESFQTLKIDIDMILQFFIWRGMNDTFKTQMINITNKSKPSLHEIRKHIFEATERYDIATKRFKDRKNKYNESKNKSPQKLANCFATNVNYKSSNTTFYPCILCTDKVGTDADHPIHQCNVFGDPDAKLKGIKTLKGCVKCGRLGHQVMDCQYNFKYKCKHCDRSHMAYLCDNDLTKKWDNSASTASNKFDNSKSNKTKNDSVKSRGSKAETNNNTAWIEQVLQSNIGGNSALPTFTCQVNDKIIRGMRDSGSQANFVTEDLAKKLGLKILQPGLKLTINGINGSRLYKSKLVELKITWYDQNFIIKAICLPSISTKLELPHLGNVVKILKDAGHILADQLLTEDSRQIDNIEIILGSEAAHYLPEQNIVFGQSEKSMISITPIGLMIMGNMKNMVTNLNSSSLNEIDLKTNNYFSNISDSKCKQNDNSLHISQLNKADSKGMEILNADFAVLDEEGEIIQSELEKATSEVLDMQCKTVLNYDKKKVDESSIETNDKLVKFVLNSTTQKDDGRLVMPLMWNSQVSHLLGENQFLAQKVLKSNLRKYSKKDNYLKLMDEVFKEQVKLGIIERIENLPQFLEEHPNHSFLAHMGVFKFDRETTKCRVVYLSNLCDRNGKNSPVINHNQAMLSGPCLNRKLSTSILLLRFDRFLLCFDIKKAFLQIALSEVDQNRLLFLWFRNVERKDFSMVGYRTLRLPFGLKCSPTILMLGLYKILMLDNERNSTEVQILKRLVYDLIYMDNGAFTTNDPKKLKWALSELNEIFNPYQFFLQQFVTNHYETQSLIDAETNDETPQCVKLFGLLWDKHEDTLCTRSLSLNSKANTKRLILQSIASNFDLFNFNGPVLNRARLFLHELQCNSSIGWDTLVSSSQSKEWNNISKQLNATPKMTIKRFIGKRDGKYKLICFSDSSKLIYGVVIFIQEIETGQVNFLLARNRLVNKQLENKSIPSLEFQAIVLGAETLISTYNELSGPDLSVPVNIVELRLYSDSMVSLHWINSYVHRLDKMQKRSIFIMNRLSTLTKICQVFPIKFSFVSGYENPADCISRPLSYRQLQKSNYFVGPKFLTTPKDSDLCQMDILDIIVPDPMAQPVDIVPETCLNATVESPTEDESMEHLIPVDKYSCFQKLVRVHVMVLKFIYLIKQKLFYKNSCPTTNFDIPRCDPKNLYTKACQDVILRDQQIHFLELFQYFSSQDKKVRNIPNLITQLNVFPSSDGLLRVRSKCEKGKGENKCYFPILLSNKSSLTRLLILDLHEKNSHSGCYSLLSELRKRFWVPSYFSLIKKILKSCIICKRFNERPIKLNQSPYRDSRINPPSIPFKSIFIDHLGPYQIKMGGNKMKVWILCITCLWSRAINLKLCIDLTTEAFLRAFQLHSFEYGIPETCFSDMGTQLVAGANIISDFLKDTDTQLYFQENNVKAPLFEQYFKGNSSLGSLVESCVKLTKRLIYGSIRNNVLNFLDFEFIIAQTNHLVNRRPIAFKEGLRDNSSNYIPEPITPEVLLKGHTLISVNVIPALHPDVDGDPSWKPNQDPTEIIKDNYVKLKKARERLIDVYNDEFLSNLITQAVSSKDRYRPVEHKELKKGDIVLLKEKFLKPSSFPMGIVKDIQKNSQNEVTGAIILKGKTREIVKRHVSSLIRLLESSEEISDSPMTETMELEKVSRKPVGVSKQRKTALVSREKTNSLIDRHLV